FTWGDTAYECYMNSLEVIEQCAEYIQSFLYKQPAVFGGARVQSLSKDGRRSQAVALASVLRGLCSSHTKMIGHFTDDDRVLEFVNSKDIDKLAPMGTSCPDHFLRTKISPLVLQLKVDEDLTDVKSLKEKLQPEFEAYRKMYADYYDK